MYKLYACVQIYVCVCPPKYIIRTIPDGGCTPGNLLLHRMSVVRAWPTVEVWKPVHIYVYRYYAFLIHTALYSRSQRPLSAWVIGSWAFWIFFPTIFFLLFSFFLSSSVFSSCAHIYTCERCISLYVYVCVCTQHLRGYRIMIEYYIYIYISTYCTTASYSDREKWMDSGGG